MVDFYLSGGELDPDVLTSLLGISPTEVRRKDEFKLTEFAANEWSLSTGYHNSRAISTQLYEALDLLKGKEDIILGFRRKYGIQCGFNIVVRSTDEEMPEMVLPRRVVSFAGLINAQVAFDIYYL